MDRKGREASRLQNEVTRRLEDFEKKGLLSAKMTEHYKMAIVKARANPIKFKLYVEQVQKDLDRINNENNEEEETKPQVVPSPTSSTFSSGTSASVSAFTEIASAANSNTSSAVLNKHAVSLAARHDLRKSTGAIVNHRQEERETGMAEQRRPSRRSELPAGLDKRTLQPVEVKSEAVNPKVVSENRYDDQEKIVTATKKAFNRGNLVSTMRTPMVIDVDAGESNLDDEQLQELFVEMCFFARLGFIQPPCCLRCTYREALKDGNAKAQCSRWVLWRKDTNQVLHPKQLEGNMIMVQCHSARRLLAGKTIDGFTWLADRQEVCQNSSY